MRSILVAGALATGILAMQSSSAFAFGDTCLRPVEAAGRPKPTMDSARASAIGAWQRTVRRVEGVRFSDWWYSGDRVFTCTWESGLDIVCRARAIPCAPRR